MEANKKEITVYTEASKGERRAFKIKIGEVYFVNGKIDLDAADGFQEERTSRLPSPIEGAKTTNLVVEDPNRSSNNPSSLSNKFYDTCMTQNSKRLREILDSQVEIDAQLETIKEYIIEPMEMIYGPGVLSPTNVSFWTSEKGRCKIYKSRFFDTSEPEQLMQLYLLIMNKELAPEDFSKRPDFQFAHFTISNFEDTIDSKTKNAFERNSAVTKFMTLLETNTEEAGYILEYAGISGVSGFTGKEELNVIFTNFLEEDLQNAKNFLNVYNKLTTKSGVEILNTYKILIQLNEIKALDRVNKEYFLDGQELGINLRDAAETILSDKNLKKSLLEKYKKIEK